MLEPEPAYKHTPGPWRPLGNTVLGRTNDPQKLIATVHDVRPEQEREANLKLIGCAPELLTALFNLSFAVFAYKNAYDAIAQLDTRQKLLDEQARTVQLLSKVMADLRQPRGHQ